LGLAIVKACVDLHGGSIAIDSRPHGGTTVSVTLPKQYSPQS
jgi:signal transduction histidine kinase